MSYKKRKGSLELTWINKDKSLIYECDEEGNPTNPQWVEKNDIRVSEPRILKLKKEYGDPKNENMLIKGDNLLALKTLVQEFKNKEEKDRVKCVYIDPPFNTKSAFEHYEDNLEHSEWLTMMRDRLVLLKKILRKDGLIFIHIDENELSYLKVLMDEIYGRNNFLSLITIKSKASAGVGQESFLFDICEYLLVYVKEKAENYVKFITEPISENVTKVYNKILIDGGNEKKVDTITGGNVGDIDVYVHDNPNIVSLPMEDRNQKNYYLHYKRIFRTTNPQGGLMKRVMPQLPKEELVSIEYTPTKGRSAGEKYRYFFYQGALIVWLRDTAVRNEKNKEVEKLIKNNNLWINNLYQGIANEGGVNFKQSKKPEKLVKRIIEMSTKEGDLILDSFAGSGTTASVAHKMRRRWIAIELGEHAETHCKKRLRSVIDKKNTDTTGISSDEDINWSGGGGFRYYILGDSLIKDHDIIY